MNTPAGPVLFIGAALGTCVGSFIAAATLRWSTGRSIGGRSRCETCSAQLRWFELFPLLSYVALKGRCGHCRAAIGRRQPIIELLAGLAAIAALATVGSDRVVPAMLVAWGVLAVGVWIVERPTSRP